MCSQALPTSLNACHRAVGIPCLSMKSFAKALLASIWAADFLGPKHGTFASVRASVIPFTSGASGPTTTKSTLFATQYFTTLSLSFGLTAVVGTFSILFSFLVPALPGARNIFATWFDRASFQAIACSLPPPPMTRTLSPIFPTESFDNTGNSAGFGNHVGTSQQYTCGVHRGNVLSRAHAPHGHRRTNESHSPAQVFKEFKEQPLFFELSVLRTLSSWET